MVSSGGNIIDTILSNGIPNGENSSNECISFEEDLLMPLSQTKSVYVFRTPQEWWSQIKTAGSAIYANRNYLKLYRKTNPELLRVDSPSGPKIIGDVFIDPSAIVDPTATVSLTFIKINKSKENHLLECFQN